MEANQKTMRVILASGLWVATAALGFLAIPTLLEIILTLYAFFVSGDPSTKAFYGGVGLRTALTLPVACLYLAVVVGGVEYHIRHFDEPDSWQLFTRTLAAESGVFIIYAMLNFA